MTRTLVVGAGPAGLATTLALRCHGLDAGLRVVDPTGRWMTAWHRRFEAQDIPVLRSPAVHHPHPDAFALLADGQEGLVRSGGTQLPTPRRFAAFCDRAIADADVAGMVERAGATRLSVGSGGRVEVTLDTGETVRPERVVLATNRRRPAVPGPLAWLAGHPRVLTSEQAHLGDTPTGGRVVVIGSGLSAAHLAVGAARRGAQVTHVTRRGLAVRRFDVHPSWLGPRKRHPFEREPDPHVRRRAVDRARGGGTIPARMRRELEDCAAAGRLRLAERCCVVGAGTKGEELVLRLDDGTDLPTDEVWLATGGRVDVADDPLCTPLLEALPTTVADGLPELEPDLSWPGSRVHVTGFAAALRLGPTAGNLVGHRRAALRVTAALPGDDPGSADRVTTGIAACPRHGTPAGGRPAPDRGPGSGEKRRP